jgi:uncharacterized protein (TIGR03435 family)
MAPGMILVSAQTMAQFAAALARLSNTGMSLNRPVVDHTGLTGVFDLALHFTPDRVPDLSVGDATGVPAFAPPDPNGPSLFTALQEQLGLKLESQRGPVDVLVIDRAEQPTEN